MKRSCLFILNLTSIIAAKSSDSEQLSPKDTSLKYDLNTQRNDAFVIRDLGPDEKPDIGDETAFEDDKRIPGSDVATANEGSPGRDEYKDINNNGNTEYALIRTELVNIKGDERIRHEFGTSNRETSRSMLETRDMSLTMKNTGFNVKQPTPDAPEYFGIPYFKPSDILNDEHFEIDWCDICNSPKIVRF